MCREAKHLSHPICKLPDKVKQGDICLLISAFTLEVCVFRTLYLLHHYSGLCALCWRFCCLYGSEHSTDVLSGVFLSARRPVCLAGKVHVSHKLHLGLSYSAHGYERNAHESSMYIKVALNRKTHKVRLYID